MFRNMEVNTKSSGQKGPMVVSGVGLAVRRVICCFQACNLTLFSDIHVLF